MVSKFLGWIVDGYPPNDRKTLKLILINLLFSNYKIVEYILNK